MVKVLWRIMKSKSFIYPFSIAITMIILSSVILYAGAVIINFRGEPGTNKVTLKWSTLSEVNCKGFEIERSLNQADFKKIGFKKASGNSSAQINYVFEDKNVYKSAVSRTFYYRLKIVNLDGSSKIFSQVVAVTPSISGARYTWGSIKALFR